MIQHPARRMLSTMLTICLGLLSPTLAQAGGGPVTPYGAHCKDCSVYGSGIVPITPEEAIHAIRKYYEERGYSLGTIVHKGRFVAAEILQNNEVVDKVIFDRKTGRLRSVY